MNIHIESWSFYFYDEEYSHLNSNILAVTKIKKWLELNVDKSEHKRILSKSVFEITLDTLQDLASSEEIENELKCISCAVSEMLLENGLRLAFIKTRIISFSNTRPFYEISTKNVGKLIQITGNVCRIGPKRPLFTKLHFKCVKCKEIVVLSIQNNVYKYPKKCKGSCKSKIFTVMTDHPEVKCRDFQEIKVQEVFYESKMPRMIEAILYDDLVGCLIPGEVVHLIGIVKAEEESKDLYKLVLHVNNIRLSRSRNFVQEEVAPNFKQISEMSKTENLLSSLIHSIFPNIFGNEVIKLGLLLALFGGSEKFAGESKVRSEIHVLIIGDPGLGKSKMLLSSSSILPKSTYVCGNFTTTAGLTVSLIHDPGSGDFIAEAGALVLADNGVCCLDEFDKIENHKSLYEVMEQQKVTVAKGGVVCSVPARTTILAASNPKFGHFKKDKSLKQNVKFEHALLSRFDLVFVLHDNLDENHNLKISNYILNKEKFEDSGYTDFILNQLREDQFLENLKRTKETKVFDLVMLREYVAYAKSMIRPLLSKQAKERLKSFYLSIRKSQDVTIRDLESLIRLCEARAKVDLRTIATQKDAEFTIELFKRSLFREATKNDRKPRNGLKSFLEIIKKTSKDEKQHLFTSEEIFELMNEAGVEKPKHEFLETLNMKGMLIKKGKNMYKLL